MTVNYWNKWIKKIDKYPWSINPSAVLFIVIDFILIWLVIIILLICFILHQKSWVFGFKLVSKVFLNNINIKSMLQSDYKVQILQNPSILATMIWVATNEHSYIQLSMMFLLILPIRWKGLKTSCLLLHLVCTTCVCHWETTGKLMILMVSWKMLNACLTLHYRKKV